MPQKIVVLLSGSGTNLQALIDAKLPISLVLSNRKNAYGLTRASKANIPTSYLSLPEFLSSNPSYTRDDYDEALGYICLGAQPDLVVLAGWMLILGKRFVDMMKNVGIDVINLHPALPGLFDGSSHAIKDAWEAFQRGEIKKTGVMIHHVIVEVDKGEPIVVREIELKGGESLGGLEERMHKAEWEIIVEATKKVLDSRASADTNQ